MSVNCIICRDSMEPTAGIYTTTCGHIFHHRCIKSWLKRSHTCPQCRCQTTKKTVHKIYLNLTKNAEVITTLQAEVNSLNNTIKTCTEKNTKLEEQTSCLRQKAIDLEHKRSVLESAKHELEQRLLHFKLKAQDSERLNVEVNLLKRKLLRADRKFKLLSTKTKKYQDENSEIIKENSKLKSYVENQIRELENKSPITNSISPAPSPSLEGKVQVIKDSKSPYLPVLVSISSLMSHICTTSTHLQRSASGFIFKNPHPIPEYTFPTPKPVVGQKRSKSSAVSTKRCRH